MISRTISIIMLAYKEPEKFKHSLNMLMKNTNPYRTPFEVIIIGNNCDEEINKFIKTTYKDEPKIYYIPQSKNLGTAKGFNLGAHAAQGEYLCFFNTDYYMERNWLERMIRCFEHRKDIGIVSCTTNKSGNKDEVLQTTIDANGSENFYKPNKYIESECAIAQMLTTSHLWSLVGGFSEEFKPITFEDLDFNEKIKAKGYKAFVDGYTFGYHDHDSNNEIRRKKIMNRNRERFIKKWGNKYKWA